jgi:hypothetical protein
MNLNDDQSGDTESQTGNINNGSQKHKIREGWEQAARDAPKKKDDKLICNFPNEFEEKDWKW